MAKVVELVYFREKKKHSVRYDPSPEVKTPMSKGYYFSKMILPKPYPEKIVIEFEWD